VLSAGATVNARAFVTGIADSAVSSATFTINPPSAGTILRTATQATAASTGWSISGTERYTWSANKWLEYSIDFGTGGNWTLGLTAKNEPNPSAPGLPPGYAYNIQVLIDGVSRGSFGVPGSTSSFQTGTLALSAPSGVHTVRFTWTNDAWTSGLYDANIRVQSVSFAPGQVLPPPPPSPPPPTGNTTTRTATQATAASTGWSISGTERYTWSANKWLEYSIDFGTGGNWTLGLTAKNEPNPSAPGLPPGYAYNIQVLIDGVSRGSFGVPGSTSSFQTGTLALSAPSGVHTVRFTWTNDAWTSGLYDANIRVREISYGN
jgi:hypothetical protein